MTFFFSVLLGAWLFAVVSGCRWLASNGLVLLMDVVDDVYEGLR